MEFIKELTYYWLHNNSSQILQKVLYKCYKFKNFIAAACYFISLYKFSMELKSELSAGYTSIYKIKSNN